MLFLKPLQHELLPSLQVDRLLVFQTSVDWEIGVLLYVPALHPNVGLCLCLLHGRDSFALFHPIQQLGLPLHYAGNARFP